MINRNELYHIPFYDKSKFTGSYCGMRYMLQKIKGEESGENRLKVTIWPGPLGYEVTPDDKKTSMLYEYSDSGIDEACEWLNEQYQINKELYDTCTTYYLSKSAKNSLRSDAHKH